MSLSRCAINNLFTRMEAKCSFFNKKNPIQYWQCKQKYNIRNLIFFIIIYFYFKNHDTILESAEINVKAQVLNSTDTFEMKQIKLQAK